MILRADEAARFLRLDDDRDMAAAVKSLQRLVARGLIRPCRLGRHNRFLRLELERFARALTQQYGEVSNAGGAL